MANNTELLLDLIMSISAETGGITTENRNQYRTILSRILRAAVTSQEPITLDPAGPKWDVDLGYVADLELTGTVALNIFNAINGDFGTIRVKQDGTGGHVLNLPAGSKSPGGGIVITPDPNAIDILTWVKIKGELYFTAAQNFS